MTITFEDPFFRPKQPKLGYTDCFIVFYEILNSSLPVRWRQTLRDQNRNLPDIRISPIIKDIFSEYFLVKNTKVWHAIPEGYTSYAEPNRLSTYVERWEQAFQVSRQLA